MPEPEPIPEPILRTTPVYHHGDYNGSATFAVRRPNTCVIAGIVDYDLNPVSLDGFIIVTMTAAAFESVDVGQPVVLDAPWYRGPMRITFCRNLGHWQDHFVTVRFDLFPFDAWRHAGQTQPLRDLLP